MSVNPTKRDLSALLADIDKVLQSDTANVIRVGYLLIEAKKQVAHGEWLPLLKSRFDFSERSARNYIAAAKYDKAKSATIADLKIAPSVLYALANGDWMYGEEVEARILKAAQTERIDADRACEIHSAWSVEQEAESQSRWSESSGEDEADAARLESHHDGAEPEAEGEAEPEVTDAEASAEARKAEYADHDDDDHDTEPADKAESDCSVITKETLMAIIAQIPARITANGRWVYDDKTEVVGCDLELYDALRGGSRALSDLANRQSCDPALAAQIEARWRAGQAQREAEKKAEQKARRSKRRAERAAMKKQATEVAV